MVNKLNGGQQLAEYNYNLDNTISSINYNTGINITYGYDLDKNIEALVSKDPQGNTINQLDYTYYLNGNTKTKIENGQITAYTYDKADRLKIEDNPVAGLITYNYDKANNMLSKQVGEDLTTYQYDKNNRLIESTNNSIITTYSYDNNGNLLKTQNINETTNYVYDGFNRLKEVNKSNGTWMYNHYNALGLRTSIEENGISYGFTYDRGSIVTEVDSNNQLISRSIRGYNLIAQKDNRDVFSYYLHNAHGDVTNLVDSNGQVLNSYQYDAFGNTLSHTEEVTNRFMYAGEQFDSITGHYYLRARYYAPNIGRFTQEDRYRGDGLNLYAYVSNNPVRYVDPSGYCKDGLSQGAGNPGGYPEGTPDWIIRWQERIRGWNEGFSRGCRKIGEEGVNRLTDPIQTGKDIIKAVQFIIDCLNPESSNHQQNHLVIESGISNTLNSLNDTFTGDDYKKQGDVIGNISARFILSLSSKNSKGFDFEDSITATNTTEEVISILNDVPEIVEVIVKEGTGNPKLYRKMSVAEAEKTLESGLQPARPGADPTKWTSESLKKVREFDNKAVKPGTEEVIVEFEMNPEYYKIMQESAVPQYGSKGNPNVKYHYEGLEADGPYRNYGIPPEQIKIFNKNILNMRIVK